jgi:MFS family permease
VIVGLAARIALEETPAFAEVKQDGAVEQRPIVDVMRNHLRTVLLVALGIIAAGTAFTMTTVFSLSYGKNALGLSSSTMLAVLLPSTVVILVCLPLFGKLADRVGIRKVFLSGAVSLIFLPFCWFTLLDTRNYGAMLLGFALLFVGYSANYAVVPVYFSQVFPPAVRFTGMSVGLTIGLIAGNAIAPSISSLILDATGGWMLIALYMSGTALISIVAGIFLKLPTTTVNQTDSVSPHTAETIVS